MKVCCNLVGESDHRNPTAISPEKLKEWSKSSELKLLGFRDDIQTLLSKAHIAVLPSRREGLPKFLLEAASCGRPIITTDVPGCREAIVPKEPGLLVPPRDSESLAEAIESLLTNSDRRREFGRAGRALAEAKYSIDDVVARHLEIYA